MPDTTMRRREDRRKREDSAFILPDKTFLGASETDIIALEREDRPRTTSRRISEERRKHPG
jgi:hypothetical protein